jgi:small conductance mechanosensitive channel
MGPLAPLLRAVLALLLVILPVAAQTPPQMDDRRFVTVDDARIYIQTRTYVQGLEGAEQIAVTVREGAVTITGTIADPDHDDLLQSLVGQILGVQTVETRLDLTTDVVQRLTPVARRLQRQTEWLVAALPLLAVALAAWGGISWLGYLIAARRWPWDRIAPNAFIAELLRMVIRLGAVLAGAVVALDILGARALLGTLLGAAGILGLAVGFAVRDVVENFIASVLLSLRSPFRPNDLIEVAGDTGRVVRLTARATILISPDGNQIRIPNATVFKARVINFSRQPERRFSTRLPVSPGADLAQAVATAQAALAAAPFVLERPAPSVWLAEIGGDGTATLEAAGWIDNRVTGFASARGEALRRMLAALCAAGISMPGIDPAALTTTLAATSAPERDQEEGVALMAEIEAEQAGGSQLLDDQTRDE